MASPALLLLAAASAGASALLVANLVTARHAKLKRRSDLVAEARRRRVAYARRVEEELAAFDAEFGDVDIEFEPVGFPAAA